MILGEDWLEAVSPAWVIYKTKKMRITLNGKRMTLQGIQDYEDSCAAIGPKKLMHWLNKVVFLAIYSYAQNLKTCCCWIPVRRYTLFSLLRPWRCLDKFSNY
jgi:hypothetical protein